jgi:hypothetical protein
MRQAFLQQINPTAPVQKGPKRGGPSLRTELLVGELDLDGLIGSFELNLRCHRLVNRACARRLRCFHLPPIIPQSVALFQLHAYG